MDNNEKRHCDRTADRAYIISLIAVALSFLAFMLSVW